MSVKTTSELESREYRGRRYFKLRSYPRFGRGPFSPENPPEAVINSPYYWWFIFLRLNEGYRETCDTKGKGKYAELYKDFGDVFSMDFKQWWSQDKISGLFAEPASSYKMLIAKSAADLVPYDSDEAINLVVPLNWSRRGIHKRFTEIINKLVEPGQRGISHEYSDAKYKVITRWNIQSFKNAHRVYLAKHSSELADENLSWADVGIRSGQGKIYGLREGIKATRKSSDYYLMAPEQRAESENIAEKRRTLSIIAQQQYRRALGFIEAAASQEFPSAIKKRSLEKKKTEITKDLIS
jgi:hypothetical protein